MPTNIPFLRVFISSPGDVNEERKIALEVIEQLPYLPAFRDKVAFRVVAWDKPGGDTAMRATMTPQDAINRGLPKPSECDIVVILFWSRMGTAFVDREGVRYESGTHWEFLDAIHGERSKDRTIIYRRTKKKLYEADDDVDMEQYKRLEAFFKSDLFYEGDRIKVGINQYEQPEEFRQQFETHFQELVLEVLNSNKKLALTNPTPEESPDNENVVTIVAETWNPERSPFPGLRAFQPEDADIFFGRGSETDALVEQLNESHFVAVVASSGSGKSSLVGAGLLPRLKANAIQGSKDWIVVRFTPAEGTPTTPFESLASALIKNIPAMAFSGNPFEYPAYLAKATESLVSSPETIAKTLDYVLKDTVAWAEVLIFIDQFEELFTLFKPEIVRQFIVALEALATGTRTRVVVTMRADFYHRALEYPILAQLLRHGSFPLAAPKRDALRQMIERPAERAGIGFEDELVERMLDDVGDEPGNLALMAYALDELYKLDDDNILTHVEYDGLGGIKGAIGTRAENVWNRLDYEESALHQAFLRLVEVDERGTATRRRSEYHPDADDAEVSHLIRAFADARLLITDYDKATKIATVEVAHEAILREWNRLSDWIEERQSDFRVVARTRRDAQWWDHNGRRDQDLPRAEQIDEFHQACARLGIALDSTLDTLLIDFAEDERERLIESLASGYVDQEKYYSVIHRLREIKGDEVAANMAILLNPHFAIDRDIREKATTVLKKLGDSRAVDALIHALSDNDGEVQDDAADALGVLRDERAIQPLTLALADSKVWVRRSAARALGQFQSPKLVEQLIKSLASTNEYFRSGCALALGYQGDKRAIEPLLLLIDDSNISVRQSVATALGNLGDSGIISSLIDMYNKEVPDVQKAVISSLSNFDDFRIHDILVSALNDSDQHTRQSACYILTLVGDNRSALPLIKLLNDSYYWIRAEAASALGMIGDKQAIEPLVGLLDDNESYVRDRTSYALGNLRFTKTLELLLETLDDNSEYKRSAGALALGYLKEESSVEPLLLRFTDNIATVRSAVALALGKIGDKQAVESLLTGLTDYDPNVRASSAQALGNLKSDKAWQPLLDALKDRESDVRTQAVTALGKLGSSVAFEAIVNALQDRNSDVRSGAVKALGILGDKRAVEPLISLLNSRDISLHSSVAKALGQLKDGRAVEPLITALSRKNEIDWVRPQMVFALGELGDNRAVNFLISLLDEPDNDIKSSAALALGELGDDQAVEPLQLLVADFDNQVSISALVAIHHLDIGITNLIRQFSNVGAINSVDYNLIWAEGVEPKIKEMFVTTLREIQHPRAKIIVDRWDARNAPLK